MFFEHRTLLENPKDDPRALSLLGSVQTIEVTSNAITDILNQCEWKLAGIAPAMAEPSNHVTKRLPRLRHLSDDG